MKIRVQNHRCRSLDRHEPILLVLTSLVVVMRKRMTTPPPVTESITTRLSRSIKSHLSTYLPPLFTLFARCVTLHLLEVRIRCLLWLRVLVDLERWMEGGMIDHIKIVRGGDAKCKCGGRQADFGNACLSVACVRLLLCLASIKSTFEQAS